MALPKDLQTQLEALKTEAIAVAKGAEAKADAVNAGIEAIKTAFTAEIKRLEDAMKAKGALSLPGSEGDSKKTFSFTKALRLLTFGENHEYCKDCSYEKDVMTQSAKLKSAPGQYATSGIAGGFFIPVEVSEMVIPLAHAKMPILDLKPTLLKNLTSNLAIPRVTARSVGYWIGENSVPGTPAGTAVQTSNSFGMINLVPKRLAAYNRISNLLLLQAPSVAEKTILDELALSIALTWHTALLYGTGTSYQPKGILKSTGIQTETAIGTSGGRFTMDHAQKMQATIDNSDLLLDGGNFAYVCHPTVKQGLKRERVSFSSGTSAVGNQGFPIFGLYQGMMDDKAVEDRIGYPIKSTTQIAHATAKGTSSTLSDVIFGDFTQLIIATWADMVLKKTDVASDSAGNSAYLQDESWFLMQMQVDTAIKNELAFTHLTDAETLPSSW